MRHVAFDKPVVVCLSDAAGAAAPAELRTPREAIAAMTRQGFGGYAMHHEAWAKAFTLLTRAALDPTPENLRVAQYALEVLASRTATRH